MNCWQLNSTTQANVPAAMAAAIVKSVGSENFADALLRCVHAVLPSTYCSIFQVVYEVASVVDVAGTDSQQSGAHQARCYLDSKFYAEDPIWLHRCDEDKLGLLVVRNVSDIRSEVYRSLCYEAIGLAQRCSLIFSRGSLERTAINFYCTRGFATSELDLLETLAPLLRAAVEQHLALTANHTPSDKTRAFLSGFNLTTREQQVLLFALHGLSNKEIARQLDLQPSTVVSYRDRAYRRLGVSRHADLVKMMLVPELSLLH